MICLTKPRGRAGQAHESACSHKGGRQRWWIGRSPFARVVNASVGLGPQGQGYSGDASQRPSKGRGGGAFAEATSQLIARHPPKWCQPR